MQGCFRCECPVIVKERQFGFKGAITTANCLKTAPKNRFSSQPQKKFKHKPSLLQNRILPVVKGFERRVFRTRLVTLS